MTQIKTENTIRVSTETEKCFVTLKEFCQLFWRGDFPLLKNRYFNGRGNVNYVRGVLAPKCCSRTRRKHWNCSAINRQKNSSNHWEVDLVSCHREEARLWKEAEVRKEVEQLPATMALKMLQEQQEKLLGETQAKLAALREQEFQVRHSTTA